MRLCLFFTLDASLGTWETGGMLEREVALYRRLHARGVEVDFITYGGYADGAYADRLSGIRVHGNRWRLPRPLYSRLIGPLHGTALRAATVIKSNQVRGGDVALAAARRFGKPFVARCGYLPAEFAAEAFGHGSRQENKARGLERHVFTGADRVVVTTEEMRDRVIADHRVDGARVRVIPNYVDTDAFQPGTPGDPRRVCFVGRLVEQKNLFALLEAARGLGVELTMAGDGHLRAGLADKARRTGVAATFLGTVPHGRLPALLNESAIFVLPSRYEGHPKTLLEAMACGRAVIGTDVPGTREIISDGVNGLLCRPEPGALREAMATLLRDPALRARLGAEARRTAERDFALDAVVEKEQALLAELAGPTPDDLGEGGRF